MLLAQGRREPRICRLGPWVAVVEDESERDEENVLPLLSRC